MNFDTWTVKRTDALRVRRLLLGSLVGAAGVAASLAFIVLSSKGAGAAIEQDEGPIEVSLAKEPEPAEPPPPPPPAAEKPKPPAPRPRLASPLAVPDDEPAEKDPPPRAEVEAPEEEERTAEPAIASAAPPPPPPPVIAPKPAVKKPIRLTEDMPKPVQIAMKKPEYPADAKSAGIEGVVVVKFVIAEDGSVRDAKVLKGPPELQSVCLEAVRAWRYQPLLIDGVPTAVVKIARFPFRIR